MTLEQYGELNKIIGRLEMVSPYVPNLDGAWYQNAIRRLTKIVEDLKPEMKSK